MEHLSAQRVKTRSLCCRYRHRNTRRRFATSWAIPSFAATSGATTFPPPSLSSPCSWGRCWRWCPSWRRGSCSRGWRRDWSLSTRGSSGCVCSPCTWWWHWSPNDRWVYTRERSYKWNESGFRPLLCTYRINWARRTSWGWWDEWDDTALQTQDSKFKPWRSEAEHATSRSRRLPTILNFTSGGETLLFLSNRRDLKTSPEL